MQHSLVSVSFLWPYKHEEHYGVKVESIRMLVMWIYMPGLSCGLLRGSEIVCNLLLLYLQFFFSLDKTVSLDTLFGICTTWYYVMDLWPIYVTGRLGNWRNSKLSWLHSSLEMWFTFSTLLPFDFLLMFIVELWSYPFEPHVCTGALSPHFV